MGSLLIYAAPEHFIVGVFIKVSFTHRTGTEECVSFTFYSHRGKPKLCGCFSASAPFRQQQILSSATQSSDSQVCRGQGLLPCLLQECSLHSCREPAQRDLHKQVPILSLLSVPLYSHPWAVWLFMWNWKGKFIWLTRTASTQTQVRTAPDLSMTAVWAHTGDSAGEQIISTACPSSLCLGFTLAFKVTSIAVHSSITCPAASWSWTASKFWGETASVSSLLWLLSPSSD